MFLLLGNSFKNRGEARRVLTLLRDDDDIKKLKRNRTTGLTIMVITPYRAQVALLSRELAAQQLDANIRVKVDTVDAFQGQEADIVLFTLVRTHLAGFTDE